jgi:hypothetical protein
MNFNLVTGARVTPSMLEAIRTAEAIAAPITLTPIDAPYYFARINPRLRLRDQHIESPYEPFPVSGWRHLTVATAADRAEINWLISVGLAMPHGDGYAVSPLAIEELYAEGRGAFIGVDVDKPAKAQRVIKLLQTYVLPGMFWRNYYVTDRLAKHIGLTHTLGAEMLEIQTTWDDLVGRFGFLGVE